MSSELPTLPEGWHFAALTDCCAKNSVTYGVVQPGGALATGKPIIRVNNFQNTRIDVSDVMYIAPEIEAKYVRTRLKGGEVLLTIVGSVGQVAVVPPRLAGFNVARAVAVLHPLPHVQAEWIALCLQSPLSQHLLGSRANTTVQTTINLKDLRALPIPLPTENERQLIVSFISALDDRITLLRETNATLEAMAQALFKSWFVDFAPIHAKQQGRAPEGMDAATAALFPDGFEESELGMVPKGWKYTAISEAVEGIYDGPHATPPDASSGGVFLGIKNLTGTALNFDEMRYIAEEDWAKWTKRIEPRAGDIVFSYEATLGFFALIPPNLRCCLGRRLALIRPKASEGTGHFWFHQLIAPPFQQLLEKHTIQGATVNRIALKEFPTYTVLIPKLELRVRFEELALPIWQKIHANQAQSEVLKSLRDTLLPRFISGQLRLPEAQALVEEATAA